MSMAFSKIGSREEADESGSTILELHKMDDLKTAQEANRIYFRLGILSMILCFALGIANIFTFRLLIIIFSVICL